jgi:AcrR family transcriptional regulator
MSKTAGLQKAGTTARKTVPKKATTVVKKVAAPKPPAKRLAERPAENDAALKAGKKKPTVRHQPAVPKGDSVLRVKRNKRSGTTIENILSATGEIILQSGAERISILDVCREADVSRGTFYRYFASQEELLDAFSRHMRDRFHTALLDAVGSTTDPDERFHAILNFIDEFLENSRARRLLTVAPEYAIRWFQRIFHDSIIRFQDVLKISFDAWENRLGIHLDRELICELLVRYILSDILVPGGPERRTLQRRLERMVSTMLSGRFARR